MHSRRCTYSNHHTDGVPVEWIPVKYQSQNLWLEQNYHGLAWNSGIVPYEEVHDILSNILRDAAKVYVKGFEKKRWLEKILPGVHNLDDLDCPPLRELMANVYIPCTNHHRQRVRNPPPHCAAYNTCVLETWLLQRQQQQQVASASVDCITDFPPKLKEYYQQCDFSS